MNQPSLFTGGNAYGEPEPRMLARHTDPPSSRKAAKKMTRTGGNSTHETIIIAILRRTAQPLTFREIFAAATVDERSILRLWTSGRYFGRRSRLLGAYRSCSRTVLFAPAPNDGAQ